MVQELLRHPDAEVDVVAAAAPLPVIAWGGGNVMFIYLFIYTYNDILNNAEAINIEVMMRMLQILWKETERKRVVEN